MDKDGTPTETHKEVDDSAPIEKLEVIKYAKFEEKEIDHEKFRGMDIAFVLDATGSMGPYILQAKESIKQIMKEARETLDKLKADESLLRFGIVAYRDHPPQDISFVTKLSDFSNASTAIDFLDKLTAAGGGDVAEAVIDGLNDAVFKLNWGENTEKLLFHVLDHPPHGRIYGSTSDGFPEGCPCKTDESKFLMKMRDDNIKYTIIRVGYYISKMLEVFSQYVNIEVMILPNQEAKRSIKEEYASDIHYKSYKHSSCCGGGCSMPPEPKYKLKVRKSGEEVECKEDRDIGIGGFKSHKQREMRENAMSHNIAHKVNSHMKKYM